MAHLFDGKKGKQDFEALITPKLEALKTTFQDNVNSMYNALVGKGKTPTAKTPAAISTAITNIFDDVYTKFVNQGTTPSAKTVSGMSSAVDSLATAKYNAGKTDGYNNGVAATKKGNAGAGDVLSGKTFTNSSSVNATGTMANKGAWTSTPTGSGKTTIPKGYHNGSGYVDTSTVYWNGLLEGIKRINTNSRRVAGGRENTISISDANGNYYYVNGNTRYYLDSVSGGTIFCRITDYGTEAIVKGTASTMTLNFITRNTSTAAIDVYKIN